MTQDAVRLNPFRRQPPVYSPVPMPAVIAAVRESAIGETDPCAQLGDLLRREYTADRVVLCASGTMALQLAIRAAIDREGAETPVALPAFTCYDVAAAAVGAGARIAFYDVDPHTLGPDLDSLDAVLRAGAGVVVVAHLFGVPVDWDSIERLAAARGALVIEDAAQGHGGRWNGRHLGSLGRISVLSFGRGKGWTGGGGGALLLRSGAGDLDLGALIRTRRALPSSAWLRALAQAALARPTLYGIPASIPWLGLGETHYHAPAEPEAMGRFTAALVIHSRAAAQREAEARRRNGGALAAAVEQLRSVTPVRIPDAGASPGFLRFPVRVRGGFSQLAARDRLARLGAAPSYPRPLARLTEISTRLVTRNHRFAGAELLAGELVTVPSHSLLTARDRQQVLRLLDINEALVG